MLKESDKLSLAPNYFYFKYKLNFKHVGNGCVKVSVDLKYIFSIFLSGKKYVIRKIQLTHQTADCAFGSMCVIENEYGITKVTYKDPLYPAKFKPGDSKCL